MHTGNDIRAIGGQQRSISLMCGQQRSISCGDNKDQCHSCGQQRSISGVRTTKVNVTLVDNKGQYHPCVDNKGQLYLGGWSGGAKVLCILHHWGVQLILAYSWARPAILVVGKGRGGMFLFLLFLHFHSCSSFFPVPLFHLLYSLFYLFSPFLWETTQNDPQGLTCR